MPEDISGLYPQPPRQQQNALDPISLIPTIQGMQRFNADKAVGNAFQGAVGANGLFDPAAAGVAIKGNPDAALSAPGAVAALLAAQSAQKDIATKALNLGITNNAAAAAILAPYANSGSVKQSDIPVIKAKLAAAGIDPGTVAAADINSVAKTQNAAKLGAIQTMGPAAAASPTTGTPGANLAPTTVPLASTLGSGSRVTGVSPTQTADTSEYLADQTATANTLKNVRPLQQALPLIEKLSGSDFGKGSPELATLKGILVTAGIMDPNSTALPTRQEAQKYLNQYVSGSPHASDMGLSQDKMSKPNFDITQPANLSLIKNSIAMDRMDAALPKTAPNGATDYKNYKSGYYQNQDPRAFQFDIMSPTERAAVLKSLGPKGSPAYVKFVKSYNDAKNAGVITPPQPGQ